MTVELSLEQAMKIRDEWVREGPAKSTLGTRYAVSASTVGRILKGLHPTVLGLQDVSRQRGRQQLSRWPYRTHGLATLAAVIDRSGHHNGRNAVVLILLAVAFAVIFAGRNNKGGKR